LTTSDHFDTLLLEEVYFMKKPKWQVFTNHKPKLSPPRGRLQLVVNNAIPTASSNYQEVIPLWTQTPLKTILKAIKEADHPAALNVLQKLTINHPSRLEIMMALFDARHKLTAMTYPQGA
jgi:hypothetical protein